jgi:hypothetical protein
MPEYGDESTCYRKPTGETRLPFCAPSGASQVHSQRRIFVAMLNPAEPEDKWK